MEYLCDNTENKRILIVTDIHYCDKKYHDTERKYRRENLLQDIEDEYDKKPFDMILCLGDYSLDFWAYKPYGTYLNTPSVSDTAKFMEEIYPELPVKAYMIPGNHEQYGNEKWKEITGFPRQFSVVYDDYVFVMCDTFAGNLDPTEHSDGTYTGVDVEFLKSVLNKHSDKKIVLCVHDLYSKDESDELKKIICENDNIVCAFAGHIHSSKTVMLGKEWRNLPVFYCGEYSYCVDVKDGHPNWGFRILDMNDGFSTVYRRKIH